MGALLVEPDKLDLCIRKLRRIAEIRESVSMTDFSFQGDFSFTESAKELRQLVDQNRVLWYQAAGFEGNLMEDMKMQILVMDDMQANRMRLRHE